MEVFLKGILDYFLNFFSRYSFFLSGEYYENLFSKYFSVSGFISGFIFVVLVYYSSEEDERISGFFKVLPIIAIINCCNVFTEYINGKYNQGLPYQNVEAIINAPDNIISGFILTLVIYSCYKELGKSALLFGIACHAALPLQYFSSLNKIPEEIPVYHMVLRILLIGFICLIMCHRKYFFTCWIWYFVFHLLTRVAVYFMPWLLQNDILPQSSIYRSRRFIFQYTVEGALNYFSRFVFDIIVFVGVLAFAILFEKYVLKKTTK